MSNPEIIETKNNPFYVLDFDRTLVDSDTLLSVLIKVSTENYLDIPEEQIRAADADVKARGDSFDTAEYIKNILEARGQLDRWEELEKHFIHASRSLNMLLPGARELLADLDGKNMRYGILTYGNPLWQRLKLSAAGFNHVHRIILQEKHKGRLIRSWQQEDGSFKLPQEFGGGVSDQIILLDDKAVSFEEFPCAPSLGYWVVNREIILPSQEGEVPSNVTHVDDLTQAQALLLRK